jgi:hypothetical protein
MYVPASPVAPEVGEKFREATIIDVEKAFP